MRRGGPNPNAGRRKKGEQGTGGTLSTALADPKRYKLAIDWAMDKLNDPNASDDLKYRICAAVMPFQSPRVLSHYVGKKELAAAGAKDTPDAFKPSPTPKMQ